MKPMHPRRRLAKIIRETRQLLNDKEWWNANRLDAEPFDVGAERVMLSLAEKAAAQWDAGDMEAANATIDAVGAFGKAAQEAE